MQLRPQPFDAILRGEKTIELRLYDEKRRQIRVGDTILFMQTETHSQMRCRVSALHLFPDFQTLYATLPLLQCGYTEETIESARPEDMRQYYGQEQETHYGVEGIALEKTSQ